MQKRVFIIEVKEGSDKGFDGFRPDTKPILNAIEELTGIKTEIVFFVPEKKDKLFEYLKANAKEIISRINPGNLKQIDEYFQFLDALSRENIAVHTHPSVIRALNFKDILSLVKNSSFGEKSSYFYTKVDDFRSSFPSILKQEKTRVLKTNYGSTGEGVYLVSLKDNGEVVSTEAVNNEEQSFANIDEFVADFAQKFEQEDPNAVFFKGKKGFVSCKYLPRISEGEIRVLLVKEKIVSIVHKKPKEGEFSATLFSGAKYTYDDPKDPKWADVVKVSNQGLQDLSPLLQGKEFPLIWTLDYILDYDENKNDRYVLSEINCSCVGITTELQYAKDVAKAFLS